MIFETKQQDAKGYPFANLGMFYQIDKTRYLSPGILPSINESEKELIDQLFPNIWEGMNEL